MTMAESQYSEFYARAARLERERLKGMGFESPGSLGRSHYQRRQTLRRPLRLVAPLLLALVCGVGLKAAIHARIGEDLYQQRVADLLNGRDFARLGGAIMQVDPLTLWLSPRIAPYLR
jgi:hypothetical protein